ncbi:phosphatidylinositol-4-phosphate 5-kinase 5, partial [Trifolium medium]|nr:phosphatidylinositol-4-phosphate 5-kinase 5 [Trifolium medium]
EARRAAEKAYDVAKVDERVNRAVAAANRAANAARTAATKAVQNEINLNNESIRIPVL